MNTAERKRLRKDKPGVWVPVETGDRIEGEVVDIAAAWNDAQYDGKDPDSGFYPLLRIRATGVTPGYKQNEVLAVHAFAAVLQARILDNEPAPGETVVITYEGTGENKTKGRNAPELYRLELPGRDPQETARRVYGKLAGKRRGSGPAQVEAPASDLPADSSGLPEPLPY